MDRKFLVFALTASASAYTNNFPTEDNAFGVKVPTGDPAAIRNSSFAFLIADYGLATSVLTGDCCQQEVADLMRSKKTELEAQGKQLLFVGASGDNFYWTGLNPPDNGGADQWARWSSVYDGLTDVPWFGAMGNHDYGDSDVYATCPWEGSRVNIDGQDYASNQLDEDKGGYRAGGNTVNYHMPDFNYRVTLNALNLEIYGLDQNKVDVRGIGGDSSGHVQVDATCGGVSNLYSHLQEVGDAGESLLAESAAMGAHNASEVRNVLILQHYPDVCSGLADTFTGSAPEADEMMDIRCAFGHTHDTVCELQAHKHPNAAADDCTAEDQDTYASGAHVPCCPGLEENLVNQDGDYRYICQAANDCHYSMNGAGGGCCGGGDGVSIGRAGFGLLTFNEHGGMFLEQITTGTECEMWPAGHIESDFDRHQAALFKKHIEEGH
mmetsp:Transcript_25667/g.59961  ORF Transcript_25667/g.59961 Transcript_25667/m.59961 type:complete len:437 (-) Transcript_25667:396-1706(-)